MSRRNSFSLRMGVEELESRRLLAGNVVVSVNGSGDLSIKGDAEGNCVEVQQVDTDATPGFDSIEVSGCVGTDDTTINGGPGPFVTGLIERDLKVDLKDGDDRVFSGGNVNTPTTGVEVPRNLNVKTGSGEDSVSGFVTVGENTKIDTSSDNDLVQFVDSEFGEELEIETGKGDDGVLLDQSIVTGDLEIETSKGEDEVHLIDVTVEGSTEIETSDGHDCVEIRDSVFNDLEVELGKQDDHLLFEDTEITGEIALDGQKHFDTFYSEGVTTPADLIPFLKSFEDQAGDPLLFPCPLDENGTGD